MRFALVASCLSLVVTPAWSASPPGVDDYEKKVRPILVEHCYSCHSLAHKAEKGGLRVDRRDALLKGGENGPAIVPGKPAESLLIQAVRQGPSLKMPPKGKLNADSIAILEAWVAAGAPMPADTAPTTGIDWVAAKSHWAFQPLQPVHGNIDQLLESKLRASGIAFAPSADLRTLARRISLDLTGLPPTHDEIDELERSAKSNRDEALGQFVDRLLASPRYGERWARLWMDVARFADTKDGVLMYGDDRVRPYAYTYRDYLIRAFNEDLPYDQQVRDQLAADRVEGVQPWRLAALGFLTLGRQFDNNVHDVLDDRIDTVTRGLLGLTVSCARCHDHKYDPVSTADYYSLYGVFAGTESPIMLPPTDPGKSGPADFEAKYQAKHKEIQEMLDRQFVLLTEAARSRVGDYLVRVATTTPDPLETAIFFLSLAPDDLRPPIVARWRHFITQRATPTDPVFGPWHDLFAIPEPDLAGRASSALESWRTRPVNRLVLDALTKARLTTRADVARTYGEVLKRAYDDSKKGPVDTLQQPLVDVVASKDSPGYFPKSQTRRYMSRADTDAFGGKLQELDRLAVKEPGAPPRAMSIVDSAEPYSPRVFLRGNPARQGDAVPRQFLTCLSPENRQPFRDGSGRRELADAIISHPLAARVMVNRVWMYHFGEPLVDTPNDFGLRCVRPTQADLLDHLAQSLIADGWSLKKLNRRIVLSRAYQQSSDDRPSARKVDPENRLVWRMNRRRLDLEQMRDSMLLVSGRLNESLYGRPMDATQPQSTRRTVYGLVDRQSLPGMFRAFDFASPDQSAERRPQTTIPQQALFGMNSLFVQEQAKAIVVRCNASPADARVAQLYQRVLLRSPNPSEFALAKQFVASAMDDKSPLGPWEQLAQVLLLTNEFTFVD